jgi:DNA-binding response OmpR family regulator
MRPKIKILLAGASEDSISILKFMLITNGYAVSTATSADEALALLDARTFELLLCDLPLDGVDNLLSQARAINSETHSMILGATTAEVAAGMCADIIFRRIPHAAELLERVKILTIRKKGPRPVCKPPLAEPVILPAEAASMQMAGVA